MAAVYAKEDIKRDVKDLACIIVEDRIPRNKILKLYDNSKSFSNPVLKDFVESQLKHDITVSEITGVSTISNRFVDKMGAILSRYKEEELQLLLECTLVLLDQEKK